MKNSLNISEMRDQLDGLFSVRPTLFWTDFLVNITVGYSSLFLAFQGFGGPLARVLFVAMAAATLYRTALFIHEIAHARHKLPFFTVVWNLFAGIPLAIPSFIYYQSHALHHKKQTYGTKQDGEYIAFGTLPATAIARYLVLSFFSPMLMIARFGIITLPSFLIPPLRRWVVTRASSLIIEVDFVGEAPNAQDRKHWLWQEPLAAVFWVSVLSGLAMGKLPRDKFLWFLLLMCCVHVVNAIRTLAAHRWMNGALTPMSFEEQYLDSVNLVGSGLNGFINLLVAPVGLRFHALHHLFQGLPYHSLGEAHRRLCQSVAPDSDYLRANETSLFKTLTHIRRR